MRHTPATLLAALVALTVVAGGCEAGDRVPEDPAARKAFESAVAALAGYDRVELVFTLESTPDDLARLDEGDEVLDADAAEMILDSSLTIASTETSSGDAAAEIALNVAGNEDAIVLRVVDGSLFARADVRELFETFGGDTGQLEANGGPDFLRPAIEGQWLGVAGAGRMVERLLRDSAVSTAAGTGTAGERLAAILSEESGVTSEGADEVGDRLSVELSFRESLQDFVAVLEQIGGLPAGALPLPDATALPEGEVTLDAWVDDGHLVQLEVDLLSVGDLVGEEPPPDVTRYALRMRIAKLTSEVTAPETVTMIGAQDVLGALVTGLGPPAFRLR